MIVKKNALQSFLEENKLTIFWTCSGDKNIYGTSSSGKDYPRGLELSGIYILKDGNIEGSIRPID